jgi:hypothetical protein
VKPRTILRPFESLLPTMCVVTLIADNQTVLMSRVRTGQRAAHSMMHGPGAAEGRCGSRWTGLLLRSSKSVHKTAAEAPARPERTSRDPGFGATVELPHGDVRCVVDSSPSAKV